MTKLEILRADQKYTQKVEKLLNELSRHSNDDLNYKPAPEAWSVIQVMYHIMRSEEAALAYLAKKLSFGTEKLEKGGLKHEFRRAIIWVSLYAPIKLKAPAIVSGDFLPGTETFENASAKWRDLRRQWADFFDSMPEELASKAVYKHAIAGKLTWGGMFEFYNGHLNRHLKQIRRTLPR
jgi:lysyl-tRNA synthetase class I